AIKPSADQTGLNVRGKMPSVYVFASASGGSGGMLLDLGYAIRRALDKNNMPEASINAFIFAGAPDDPTSPPAELANIFATLTELNHFADPDVTFTAQYGGEVGPKLESHGLPFTSTYLLPMAQRSNEGFRDSISHLSSYIAHELTTPLGVGLSDHRRNSNPPSRTPFRGFGTFGVWYPRGLLLRAAARFVAIDIFRSWVELPTGELPPQVQQVTETVLSDQRLTTEQIQKFIITESSRGHEGNPIDFLRQWARSLMDQTDAVARQENGAVWAINVWDYAKDMVGLEPTTEGDSSYRRGRFSKALDPGLRTALGAWENELLAMLRPIDEMAGPRLPASDSVLRTLIAAFTAAIHACEEQGKKLQRERQDILVTVQSALEACQTDTPGFQLFGARGSRQLKTFSDKVGKFIDIRTQEDLIAITILFYRRIQGILDERLQAVKQSRDRVNQLVLLMEAPLIGSTQQHPDHTMTEAAPHSSEESMQITLQMSNTVRVVLPKGETQLNRSAFELLTLVRPESIKSLQQVLQSLVLEPRGGLVNICKNSADLMRTLAMPVVEQATAFLANLLPTQDVAEVELTSREVREGGLHRRIAGYAKLAAPVASGPPHEERTYVLVPPTEAGASFAKEAKNVVPKAVMVTVQGQGTDLLFCREGSLLRTEDLMRLIEPCWEAYAEIAERVETSPHSRFDVQEWMPLAAR
ncbi:MAG: tubulin-like doman-containing protein, partial [Gemmataceae bacterium]